MPRPLLLVLLLTLQLAADPVAYQKRWVQNTPVHVVWVNLNSPRVAVRPVLAAPGSRQTLGGLMPNQKPLAALTGTFFDTKSSVVVGNLVSDGRLLAEGAIGTTLVVDRQGQGDIWNSAGRLGRYQDWSEVQFGVSGGPTLLVSGNYFLTPQLEGFRDPSLFVPRPRSALGLTAENKMVMVSVTRDISLWRLAKIMKELGARQAINLDGGASTALYYKGQTVVRPQRQLTNLIAVFPTDQAPHAGQRGRLLARRALAHYQKGSHLLARGQAREARSQFRQALAKSPRQARYWSAYARSEQALGQTEKAAQGYYQAAQIYLDHYKPAPAMKLALSGVELAPHRADLQLLLGRAAHQAGQRGLASQALTRVLQQHPGHPLALSTLNQVRRSR